MKKDGEAIGVLYHNDVGEISLVYGNDSYGLKKISSKHPEVLGLLQDILNESIVESKSCNRIVLISHSHKVIVSKMLRDKAVNPWILTEYKKKSASASSSDIETEPYGKRNGTAAPFSTLSEDKVRN